MSEQKRPKHISLDVLDVGMRRDDFLVTLLRELSGCLQDVVGMRDAAGFVSIVGQRIGDSIDRSYREALGVPSLSAEQVAEVLVDLKRRLDGDFYVIEQTPKKIVFGNRRCPFGDHVKDRPSLCMMTSNVFGVIAAENLGFARVELAETIAEGSPECRVIVHLVPTSQQERAPGQTYVGQMVGSGDNGQ